MAGLDVEVVLKDIKNINVSVRPPDGRVRVSAPFHVGEIRIREVIADRLDWIQAHQQRMAQQPCHQPLTFEPGERVMVWGALQPLIVRAGTRGRVDSDGESLILTCPPDYTRDQKQAALDRWYRRALAREIPDLLARWEPVIGRNASAVAYRRMKTKWGTCQPRTGVIRLNTELAKYHPTCLEYVLVHELVHLLEPSHNQRFKQLMDTFLPDWRVRKQHLRVGGLVEGT